MVRTKEEITTREDYQNLVIGVLLRQSENFTTNKIIKYVDQFSEGSIIKPSEMQKRRIVSSNIDMLVRAGKLKMEEGSYKPNYDFIVKNKGIV